MRSLPRTISEVEVPEFVSPSALGTWGGCRLKLIAATRGAVPVERVGAGPEQAIGTFAHRVIEQFEYSAGRSAEEVFEAEYERMRSQLTADPARAHFANLITTKSMEDWARIRSWILSRCARSTRKPTGVGAARRSGAEFRLEHAGLRLRGSADRLRYTSATSLEVRDFKSGAVLGDDGAIKPEIRLQLLAYGLMAQGLNRNVSIRLIVDDGAEHEVSFDADAQQAAKVEIRSIIDTLPAAGRASANTLASPGPGCSGCSIRLACSAYRSTAPVWWREYPRDLAFVPKDVWGTVSAIENGAEFVRLTMSDDSGRRVKIDRIDRRHGIESDLGRRLWMFDLESNGQMRDFDGNRMHPRAFHEHPRDRRERRAWRLQVYRED